MASVRFTLENLGEDKHVEGVLIHCLDAGSTPAISTILTQMPGNRMITRHLQFKDQSKNVYFLH